MQIHYIYCEQHEKMKPYFEKKTQLFNGWSQQISIIGLIA